MQIYNTDSMRDKPWLVILVTFAAIRLRLALSTVDPILCLVTRLLYSVRCEIEKYTYAGPAGEIPLQKLAYSTILEILPPNNEIFQIKISDIFHISAQNIDCGYSLEPPRRGGSNEYPQSMF